MTSTTADEPAPACDCKVGRSAAGYGLDDLDAALRRRRTEADASLRALADFVNRRLLRAAIERAAGDVVSAGRPLFGAMDDDEAVERIFAALTDDEVAAERRARVRTRLAQAGVDVDAVESAFVTHPTVWNHLRDSLDLDTSSNATIDRSDATGTVAWARRRCASVVEQTFGRLRSAGVVTTGDLEVAVTVRLTCTACEATYSPAGLIERGACECEPPRE